MLWLWAGLLAAEPVLSAEVWSLGAYSLLKYEDDWKPALPLDDIKNPAYVFFGKMTTSPGGAEPTRSLQLLNADVNVRTVVPVGPAFGHPHWNAYRLVFFYGHNNSVPSPHACGGDPVVMLGCSGLLSECDNAWGTPAVPYVCYGCAPVTDGLARPGALTYLYNRCSSSLLGDGYDFDGRGAGCYMADCATPTPFTYISPAKLGYQLRWLILHGCQAVITATVDGTYNSTALRALHPTHGEWRVIMGHYKSYSVPSPMSKTANLDTFANALLVGQPMQAAYFDTDPDHNSSAIAAELMPFTWATSTMVNSRWSDPWTDAPDTKSYSQRWIVAWPEHLASLPPLRDLGSVAIQNPVTRQLLGQDTLSFRSLQTTYMPSNPVVPLMLETVDQPLCQARLQRAVDLGFLDPQAVATPRLIGDLLVATNEQSAAWVSRSSGSYSFMRIQDNMITPTGFTNCLVPIQIALDYGVTNGLIASSAGETVDLLSASSVQCAFGSVDAPDTPSEQFRSDYYVVFGRRFQGVPVIGSEFVVRLDGNGQVAMVRKNWRRITQPSQEQMSVSTNSVETLMTRDPRFSEFYGTNVGPANITITDRRCGYMEAPVSYRQGQLRVGGSISFSVGPLRDKDVPQMTVSLEDNVSLPGLWGWLYAPSRLDVQSYSPNACLLRLTASTGYDYRIEASPDLTNWGSRGVLSNVTNSASFLDQDGGQAQRFYRAVELP